MAQKRPRVCVPHDLAVESMEELRRLRAQAGEVFTGHDPPARQYTAVLSWTEARREARKRLEAWRQSAFGRLLELLERKLG